jgi:cell division protein FtsB
MEQFLPYVSLAFFALISLGGVLAFRYSIAKTSSEIQERVIHALQSEIQTLRDRITAIEKENTRLLQIVGIIKAALKKRGVIVTIDGDLVSIHDEKSGDTTQTSRITGS